MRVTARSIEVDSRKLLVAFAVTGALTVVLTSWLMVALLDLGQERLGARDCPRILEVPTAKSVSKRIQGKDVVCVYELPGGNTFPLKQARTDLGFVAMAAIYALNFVPVIAFAALVPGDPAYRGEPPGRKGPMGFFVDPRFELVGGAILLGMGAEFLWVALNSSTTAVFAGFGVVWGVWSMVRGIYRLRVKK